MTTATATAISLELEHEGECAALARPLFLQLSHGYEECAVQPLRDLDEWRADHGTARKRADRAHRRGYRFATIKRHRRADEIHEINLSASERQGRPMTAGYRVRPTETPLPVYVCDLHAIRTYGVGASDGLLCAYATIYRAGQLALVSQILGHADRLRDEIMWLLAQGVIESEFATDPDGFLVYNRWDSGTEGLRWFKEHAGFAPTMVEWQP